MKTFLRYLVLFALVFFIAEPAWAAEEAANSIRPLGKGLAVLGAGIGIGAVGFATMVGISRNPSAAGKIMTPFFIAAALIEGIALIAIFVK